MNLNKLLINIQKIFKEIYLDKYIFFKLKQRRAKNNNNNKDYIFRNLTDNR